MACKMLKVKCGTKKPNVIDDSVFSVARVCAQRPHCSHHCCQVYSVKLRVLCQERSGNRVVILTSGGVFYKMILRNLSTLDTSQPEKGHLQSFSLLVCQYLLSNLVNC